MTPSTLPRPHAAAVPRGAGSSTPVAPRAPGAGILALIAAVGCATDDTRGAATAERVDSAGVEIVSMYAQPAEAPVFAVASDAPDLRIGSVDGAPAEQFGAIRDLAALPSGGVAVLDAQAGELRVFDAAGSVRWTVGSRGEGPGEFQSPAVVAVLAGDTLAVYDDRLHRVTRFGPDGSPARVVRLEDGRARTSAAAFLADGLMVAQSRWINPAGGELPGPEPAFVRDTVSLLLYGEDGTLQDTLDILPGRETITSVRMGQGRVEVLRRPAAFARANAFGAHPDGVWSSEADRFELRLRSTEDGALLRIVRAPGLERPSTDADGDRIRAGERAGTDRPDDLRLIETWFDLSPRPRTLPAFDRFLTDDRGRLWVHEWPVADLPARWWVFAPDGDLLGSFGPPDGFELMSVRCRWAWGLERDELDVPYVVRYTVREEERC